MTIPSGFINEPLRLSTGIKVHFVIVETLDRIGVNWGPKLLFYMFTLTFKRLDYVALAANFQLQTPTTVASCQRDDGLLPVASDLRANSSFNGAQRQWTFTSGVAFPFAYYRYIWFVSRRLGRYFPLRVEHRGPFPKSSLCKTHLFLIWCLRPTTKIVRRSTE